MSLKRYREKRNPERTPEPFGAGRAVAAPASRRGIFVIQKHDATRLHYDLRLEVEGVLRSWAVPKGPSLNPADKHLAVAVEDHPLEYGDFEGVIPAGNYGAGAVIVWDRGVYEATAPAGSVGDAIRAGKLDFTLYGYKLHGEYTLVRTGMRKGARAADKQQWLLIKKDDQFADRDDVTAAHPRSVLSGLLIEEMYEASDAARKIEQELGQLGVRRLPQAPLEIDGFPLALAKTADEPFDGREWMFEVKYDGVRALAMRDGERPRLIGRSGADLTGQYPEVRLALAALPYHRFVIDGEIVALDESGRPSFQRLQRRMHLADRHEIARQSFAVPAHYMIFDLLAFGSFDVRQMELERRKQWLARLIKGDGPLRYCEHIDSRGRDFFAAAAQAGLEGIIAKRRAARYPGRRSADWLKIKCPQVRRFVIGGYTDPAGSRSFFGALLLGQYDAEGRLRYIDKVGTGFKYDLLKELFGLMGARKIAESPFRRPGRDEPALPRRAHFCAPELVCEVRFAHYTDHGGIRHPSFVGLIAGADPADCLYEGPVSDPDPPARNGGAPAPDISSLQQAAATNSEHKFTATHRDKIFWPEQGYTKGDLIDYYLAVADWMLPYLKDRPVMLTRYPDGIGGKSFYQKDAPGFAPRWIRREKIYSHDSQRDIAYFVLDSADAVGYMANLGAITIHIWSSHLPHLERPDWLLFDIDPKGSTTARAIVVAREVGAVLRELGLRPYVKTSGQAGLHVVVGLKPLYTYEEARMFSELVARLVIYRIPKIATINRDPHSRRGKVYIDYLQLGHGKTIAAPFSARPINGAPVSAPIDWSELTADLKPARFTIRTMPQRIVKLGRDPFAEALTDLMTLKEALPRLEQALHDTGVRP